MKNQTTVLILLLLLMIKDSHQLIRDISFIRFCSNIGPGAIMVQGDFQTMGDRCTVIYPFPAKDDDEAKEYCKLWNMYPIVEGKQVNGQVQCTYENVYECRSDYTLINGHCYRMVSQELVTFEKAVELCGKETIPSINKNRGGSFNTEIVKLFDRDLLRFFKAYFTNMRIFFIQNDKEMIGPVDYQGDSDEYAVAFGMASFYRTGPGSIIKLPIGKTAQAMCVYRAEETPLSFAYKARMFAPYYYPINIDSQIVVIRTAGHYNVLRENKVDAAATKCEASMKAIVGENSKGDVWDTVKDNVKRLSEEFKTSFVKSFAPMAYCCFYEYAGDYYEQFSGQCDKKHWNHYVVLMNQDKKNLRCKDHPERFDERYYQNGNFQNQYHDELPITYIFSPQMMDDSHVWTRRHRVDDAPVLCTLDFNFLKRPNKCEDGWSPYIRTNGLTVCHKVFFDGLKYTDALASCKGKGGSLSTFTTDAELDLINKLSNPNGVTAFKDDNIRVWLGLNKIKKCPRATTGECEREKIVEFVDPLFGEDTPETRKCIARSWFRSSVDSEDQPNHWDVQWCIDKGPWHERSTGLLNDAWCYSTWHYSCIKAATLYQ